MIVHIDDLVRVLRESGLPDQGRPPEEGLAIMFQSTAQSDNTVYDNTVEYDIPGRGSLMIDIDKDGEVISVEW